VINAYGSVAHLEPYARPDIYAMAEHWNATPITPTATSALRVVPAAAAAQGPRNRQPNTISHRWYQQGWSQQKRVKIQASWRHTLCCCTLARAPHYTKGYVIVITCGNVTPLVVACVVMVLKGVVHTNTRRKSSVWMRYSRNPGKNKLMHVFLEAGHHSRAEQSIMRDRLVQPARAPLTTHEDNHLIRPPLHTYHHSRGNSIAKITAPAREHGQPWLLPGGMRIPCSMRPAPTL